MWNMRDGSAGFFTDGTFSFWSVRFSPSGQLVAAGNTVGALGIWNVRTGQLVRRWTGHKGTVWSMAFMSEGRVLVSGGDDGVMKCWDASSIGIGNEPVPTKILKHEGKRVCLFLFVSFPVTNVLFYIRTESIQWLFLPILNGLPLVYSTTVLLSRMPTAPYNNAHWLGTQRQFFRLTSALLGATLHWAVTTAMSPFGGILKLFRTPYLVRLFNK